MDYTDEKLKEYVSRAEQGEAKAQKILADYLCKKIDGEEPEYKVAFDWYMKSAKQGYEDAYFAVAWGYDQGQGIEQDYEKANYWWAKAAEAGNKVAKYNLAQNMRNKRGVDVVDEEKVFNLYLEAAEEGYKNSWFWVAWGYDQGEGVEQNYEKANYWWAKAAEAGDKVAKYNLAQNMRNKRGVDVVDEEKVFNLYFEAAQEGHKNSMFRVAWAYDQGEGVKQDYEKANYWWLKAAELGDASAQYNLANNLYNGRGVETADLENACKWYEKAAEQGNKKAKDKLESIKKSLGNAIPPSLEEKSVCSITFENIWEANKWLCENQDIEVFSMLSDHNTSLGLIVNNVDIRKVVLLYRKEPNSQYIYRIMEEGTASLFVSRDIESIKEKWKGNHPRCEIIEQKYIKNSRASMGSLMFGFGTDYVENVTTVTLYRKLKTLVELERKEKETYLKKREEERKELEEQDRKDSKWLLFLFVVFLVILFVCAFSRI